MQAEVADEVSRCREPPNVTDHSDERCGGDDVDAWDRHEATHVLIAEDLLRDDGVDLRELLTEEVQLAQAGIDGQALVDGQLLRRDPCPPLLAERVGGGVSAFEVCDASAPRSRF